MKRKLVLMIRFRVSRFAWILTLCVSLQACFSWPFGASDLDQSTRVFSSKANQEALAFGDRFSSLTAAIEALKKKISQTKAPFRQRLLLARLYLLAGDNDQAATQAKLAEKFKFRNFESKIILAHVQYLKNYYDDVKLIVTGVLQSPALKAGERAEILNLLAGVAHQQGDDQQSIQLLEKAVSETKSVAAHMNLGLLYLNHADYRLALSHFSSITKQYPDAFNARLHLGSCYAGLGDFEKAKKIYNELYELNSNHVGLMFFLAELNLKQKDFDSALDWLEEYVDAAGDRYLAKAAAMKFVEAIQLEHVRHGGFDIRPAEKMLERLKAESAGTASFQSLANSKERGLHSHFVFTPY